MNSVEVVEAWAENFGNERLKNLWWGLGPHSRPGRDIMEALNGHRTNQPKSAYAEVIRLLS